MRIVGCSTCRGERTVNGFGRCLVCGEIVAEQRIWYWGLTLRWLVRGTAPTILLVGGWYGLSHMHELWFDAEGLRGLTGDYGDLVLGFMAVASLALFLGSWHRPG